MLQTVGYVSRTSPSRYFWILTNIKPECHPYMWNWKSPDFFEPDVFNGACCFHLDRVTMELSLCSRNTDRSCCFDALVVVKNIGAVKANELTSKNIERRAISILPGYDQYVFEMTDVQKPLSIFCKFLRFQILNVQNIRGTDLMKGEQESAKDEEKGIESVITRERFTEVKWNLKEVACEQKSKAENERGATSDRQERSVDKEKNELTKTRGEQKSKAENERGTTSDRQERSVDKEKNELTKTRGLVALSANLRDLFLGEEDTDVIIKVGDQKYPVHKLILRARSPVFQAMLKHDMIEKNNGVVDIPDCEPYIFRDFLQYLYAGNLNNISNENVFDLFQMSDKYDVKELKADCADFLLHNLTVDIIGDVISLATRHDESEILKCATEFFVENANKILPTVKWQKFVQDNPIQANELFIKAFKNVSRKS